MMVAQVVDQQLGRPGFESTWDTSSPPKIYLDIQLVSNIKKKQKIILLGIKLNVNQGNPLQCGRFYCATKK